MIAPRVGTTSAVMSPPLPHRGVVAYQFEPHIIRDLVENGIEILFFAKEGEFNPMTFTNKRSPKKANYGVIRRFCTPNNDLTRSLRMTRYLVISREFYPPTKIVKMSDFDVL